MKIVDFVRPDMIVSDLVARDKPSVIAELAAHMAKAQPEINAAALSRVLLEREKLASTAIGEDVAIPHGKLDSVSRLVSCVGRSKQGVAFDSIDGRPTHIFFVLLAPENAAGIHLKALARVSRLFKDPEFRERLLKSADADEIYRVIQAEDAKY